MLRPGLEIIHEEYNEVYPNEPILTTEDMSPQEPHDRSAEVGVVRSFFKFLFELGVISRNPALIIKAPTARIST